MLERVGGSEPHAYPRRIMLSTLIAVGIWGSFTTVAAFALETGIDPVFFGILSQLGIAICFAAIVVTRWRAFVSFLPAVSGRKLPLALASLMFPLRDLCFLLALSELPKLTVTALDALWPIFLVLLSNLLVSFDKKDFAPVKLLLLASAFLGALLLIYQTPTNIDFSFDSIDPSDAFFVAVALVGAVAAAGENVALRYVRDRSELPNTVETTVFLSALARAPFVLYAPLVLAAVDVDTTYPVEVTPNLVFIVVGWTVASIAFTYAVLRAERNRDLPGTAVSLTNIGALAYLSPVSNAILLAVFFPDEELSGLAGVGISLIVISNFLINTGMKYITATSGSAIAVIWIAVLATVLPSSTGDLRLVTFFFSFAELSGAILAIVVSFTLWRLAELSQRMQMRLASIGHLVARTLHELEGSARSSPVLQEADRLLRCLVYDSFNVQARKSVGAAPDRDEMDAYDRFIEFEGMIIADRELLRSNPVALASLVELSGKIDEWISERRAKLVVGELIILLVLAAVTIVAIFRSRPDTLAGDMFTVVFSGGIVFLVLAVRDYGRNRWNLRQDSLRTVDRLFERLGLVPYLPRDLLDSGEIPGPAFSKLYRTESRGGGLRRIVVDPTPAWMGHTASGLMLLGVGAAVALLLVKHGVSLI